MGNCSGRDEDLYDDQLSDGVQPEERKKRAHGKKKKDDLEAISEEKSDHASSHNVEPPEQIFLKQKQELVEKQAHEIEEMKEDDEFQELESEQQEEELKNLENKHEEELQELIKKQQEGYFHDQLKSHDQDHGSHSPRNGNHSGSNHLYHQNSSDHKRFNNLGTNYILDQQESHLKTMVSDIQPAYDIEDLQKFYIVTCVFSPIYNKQKVEQYQRFANMCAENGLKLITIEFTNQGCPFVVTQQFYEPYHIQIRVQEALSLKYNLVNVILGKIPDDWGWIAVVDYNVIFNNFDWVEQCKENLQTTVVQQLYEVVKVLPIEALANENRSISQNESKEYISIKECLTKHLEYIETDAHEMSEIVDQFEAGRAIAFRRDFVQIFGMQDCFITGFEEYFLLLCLAGKCKDLVQNVFGEGFLRFIENEYEKAFQSHNLNYGYIEGNEIEVINITQGNYNITAAMELLSLVFDNLKKDHNGFYITQSDYLKFKNEDFKGCLL